MRIIIESARPVVAESETHRLLTLYEVDGRGNPTGNVFEIPIEKLAAAQIGRALIGQAIEDDAEQRPAEVVAFGGKTAAEIAAQPEKRSPSVRSKRKRAKA